MRRLLALALVNTALAVTPLAAQPQHGKQALPPEAAHAAAAAQPAAAPQPPPAAQTPAAPDAAQPAPAAYRYAADGRRDPFLSLIGTGGDSKVPAKTTGEGLAGVRVDDVSVRGVIQSRERFVAMVQGPDNRSYVVHQGDRLADGVVKSVAPDGLVLVQELADPRSREKAREVRKPLRVPAEGKE